MKLALLLITFAALLSPIPRTAGDSAAGDPPPAPAFHRVWEQPIADRERVVFSDSARVQAGDGWVFFTTDDRYGVIDTATGALCWMTRISESSRTRVRLRGETVLVASGNEPLRMFDAASGALLSTQNFSGMPLDAAELWLTDNGHGIVIARSVAAREPDASTVRWSVDLRRLGFRTDKDGGLSLRTAATVGRDIVVATSNRELARIDAAIGRVLWRRTLLVGKHLSSVAGIVVADERIYATAPPAALALDARTGAILWRRVLPSFPSAPLLHAGALFVAAETSLYALDPADGRVRWRKPTGERVPWGGRPIPWDSDSVLTAGGVVQVIDADGRGRWKWDTEETGRAYFGSALPLGDRLLLYDHRGIALYAPGAPPPPPADPAERAALARRLARNVDDLDREQTRQLRALGDDAFTALLPIVRARRDKALDDEQAGKSDSKWSMIGAWREVLSIAPSSRTAEVWALVPPRPLARPDRLRTIREEMLRELVETSESRRLAGRPLDDRVFLPWAQATLSGQPAPDTTDWEQNAALEFAADCPLPPVTEFLRHALRDPNAPPDVRRMARVVVAARLGAEALPDLRATASESRRIAPAIVMRQLETLAPPGQPERYAIFNAPRRLATGRDRQNRVWCLFTSDALGDGDNLWVARWSGARWIEPTFTGVAKHDLSRQAKMPPPDWLARWALNSAIRRDSDGDGLTDPVERRLGTDPRRADTDGDGLADAIDASPLAAPCPLSDTEQILAAAYEALEAFSQPGPAVQIVMPPGIVPMEFASNGSRQSARRLADTRPRPGFMGYGWSPTILFRQPAVDFDGNSNGPDTPRADPVVFSPDGTQARVQIEVYFGFLASSGTDLTLRKLDGVWVVIEVQGAWVS